VHDAFDRLVTAEAVDPLQGVVVCRLHNGLEYDEARKVEQPNAVWPAVPEECASEVLKSRDGVVGE